MEKYTRKSFLGQLQLAGAAGLASIILPSDPHVRKPDLGSIGPASSSGKKLNIALCGLGNYASVLADGLEASQFCHLAGIVSGHPAKAKAWKAKYKLPDKNVYNYQNFDQIVHNPSIDLVYVVLPNGLHKDFTVRAAKAGKHVICEKPMATSASDCREMTKACKDGGVQLAIGYRLHFEPTHFEIKRLGQQKVFGQVRFIEASLGYQTYDGKEAATGYQGGNPAHWRLNKALAGGGPLMDLGIYCVQCSRYVLGEEPVTVTAQFGPTRAPKLFAQVEEAISWQLTFPSGAICNSTTSSGYDVDRFFATADEGQFELSPALSYGPFLGKSTKGPIRFLVINQQATEMDTIAKLLLENKALPSHITGEEGIKDVRIIEAIYEAARTGRKVKLV